MRRSFTTAIVVVAVAAGIAPRPSLAQSDYPNRVVKIVVPYGAASAPDILVRALAPGLSSRLGQQFIVENKAGGSGALGTASVVRAEPDGYTLLFAPAVVLSVLPQARNADAGYKPDAVQPICQTFVNTMGLIVRPDSPIRSIADLVAAAKQKPGALNYGHPGLLTIPQLAVEEFQQVSGIDIKDIPFRTGPQSITELLGGRLDVVSQVMGTEVGQNIRVIGVFSEKRIATFPDVPTVKEQGYDVTPSSFGGLLAPFGTPAPIISKLSSACAEAAKDNIYATTAKRAGQPDDYYDDAAAFRARLAHDIESKARVLSRLKTQ
jgi:tripartite-type tricarboxylate transporter receptor subunit TctC